MKLFSFPEITKICSRIFVFLQILAFVKHEKYRLFNFRINLHLSWTLMDRIFSSSAFFWMRFHVTVWQQGRFFLSRQFNFTASLNFILRISRKPNISLNFYFNEIFVKKMFLIYPKRKNIWIHNYVFQRKRKCVFEITKLDYSSWNYYSSLEFVDERTV